MRAWILFFGLVSCGVNPREGTWSWSDWEVTQDPCGLTGGGRADTEVSLERQRGAVQLDLLSEDLQLICGLEGSDLACPSALRFTLAEQAADVEMWWEITAFVNDSRTMEGSLRMLPTCEGEGCASSRFGGDCDAELRFLGRHTAP